MVRNAAGLSEAALIWGTSEARGEVVSVSPLGGGITHTKWVLGLAGGERLVLRWADPTRWGSIGREHVRREVLACQLLADSPIPVPGLISSDVDGRVAGGPASLLSWRGGHARLDPLSAAAIEALARAAVAIHRHPVPAANRLPMRIRGAADPAVPTWTFRPRLWQQAIEMFRAGAPATPRGLLHSDFHLGNVLWEGDALTGIIDWAETSWGPPDLDVAHMCADFAMMHTPAAAASFRDAYLRVGGRLDASRFWVISDILGFLPDPAHILPAVSARPDLTAESIRSRLEGLLALSLA